MKHLPALLFLAALSLPYLFSRGPAQTPIPAEQVSILSPHRREMKQEYSRAFAEWTRRELGREIGILWLDAGGGSKMMKDLESRFRAHPEAPGVDLLFGGGVDPYLQASAQGWLAPLSLPEETLADIPPTCAGVPVRDPEGRWCGVAMSGFGLLAHRGNLARLGLGVPAHWRDLADPRLCGWVASGDPRASGSVHMGFEILLQAMGWEAGWRTLAAVAANVRSFGESGGTAPLEVASGEAAAGIAIDQYAHTVMAEDSAGVLDFILPPGATVINPDAIGRLRGGPAPELAEAFVRFALSVEGQRLLFRKVGNGQVHALHRTPIRRSLCREPDAPRPDPYGFGESFGYDASKGGRRWNVLNGLMGAWLLDGHADLVRAWRAVIARGARPEEVEALFRPPLSEDALEREAGAWREPSRRLGLAGGWSREAAARYRRIAAGE